MVNAEEVQGCIAYVPWFQVIFATKLSSSSTDISRRQENLIAEPHSDLNPDLGPNPQGLVEEMAALTVEKTRLHEALEKVI